MTYEILETTFTGGRRQIDTAPTYDAAEAAVRARFNLVHLEADRDYPGCADFLTLSGMVGSIQPVGFTL